MKEVIVKIKKISGFLVLNISSHFFLELNPKYQVQLRKQP